ncbi:hypothetical protein N7470_004045 [Penicillium chermesinum]|nr:hypothetical protein N7470_004045 [Penicillium chermesinum]
MGLQGCWGQNPIERRAILPLTALQGELFRQAGPTRAEPRCKTEFEIALHPSSFLQFRDPRARLFEADASNIYKSSGTYLGSMGLVGPMGLLGPSEYTSRAQPWIRDFKLGPNRLITRAH